MTRQECNLNIRYDLPDELLDKLPLIYEYMTGWLGLGDKENGQEGIPYWFSYNENEKFVLASLEPSGLMFIGKMDAEEWKEWIFEFKQKATQILGFKVGEIETGEVSHTIEWLSSSKTNLTPKKKKWWMFK